MCVTKVDRPSYEHITSAVHQLIVSSHMRAFSSIIALDEIWADSKAGYNRINVFSLNRTYRVGAGQLQAQIDFISESN